MSDYERGTVVSVKTRKGTVDCAVMETRRVSKGRQAGKTEYRLAPLEKVGNTFAFTAVGEQFFGPPTQTYKEKEVQAALARCSETGQAVAEKREEKKERGREALGDPDWDRTRQTGRASCRKVAAGDEVLVRYTTGTRWEKVVEVNYATGKVGISRSQGRGDDDFIRDVFSMFGPPSGRKREVRWIHPDHVEDVRAPQKANPRALTAAMTERLEKDGWVQATWTNGEFITASCVVAKERANATRGATYDSPDGTVYQDPATGLYWRDTGFFD